jgi:hypothetical protein
MEMGVAMTIFMIAMMALMAGGMVWGILITIGRRRRGGADPLERRRSS